EVGIEIVDPTPISYTVSDNNGLRLETDATIILNQSVVAEVSTPEEVCDPYESDSVSSFNTYGLVVFGLLATLFALFYFRKEETL
ncbi:MAG: Unknown protein, partial [uncultured Sulfurovum sp.]